MPPSIVAASNNGLSPVFSFVQVEPLPVPPVGYIVQVTNAGALQVQCAGTFGNIIPVGPQVLMPCSITYVLKPKDYCTNTLISDGFTNTTEFTGRAAADGFRDSHANAAFEGVLAWTWSDNSTVADKTNGTMNCMVAIGKVGKNGKIKVRKPIQLTDFGPGLMAWDTAVAIVNKGRHKGNIVVSYGVIDLNAPRGPDGSSQLIPYRAVSTDGGLTFPINGPLNIQPTGNPAYAADNRGVSCDAFGNIWYSATNRFDENGIFINQPYFAVSSDGGVYHISLPIRQQLLRSALNHMILFSIVLVGTVLETMDCGLQLIFITT